MTLDENIAIVRRYYESVASGRDLAVADEILATDCLIHEPQQQLRGTTDLKRRLEAFLVAFPDLECSMDDAIAQGEKVATRYTVRGTHRGPFAGAAPTGNQITMGGMMIFRLADGRIQEAWGCADLLGFRRQLNPSPTAE
ncbi:MAG TPA: ester cyclase [Vicinamibacteria bacterium]